MQERNNHFQLQPATQGRPTFLQSIQPFKFKVIRQFPNFWNNIFKCCHQQATIFLMLKIQEIRTFSKDYYSIDQSQFISVYFSKYNRDMGQINYLICSLDIDVRNSIELFWYFGKMLFYQFKNGASSVDDLWPKIYFVILLNSQTFKPNYNEQE